jgi:hypothetical protein
MFDVSPLVPEARQTVRAAAQIYWQHTRPWFIGLLVHGSALKGGVIPGGSDIDLQLFLTEAAFDTTGDLPLRVSAALHRALAQIDPVPFQYIQCYALATPLPADASQEQFRPIPGAYQLLAGTLPVPEATPQQVREQASQFLATLRPDAFAIASRLLQHGGGHLERTVRALCTDVWPTLYHLVAWQARNPLEVWALPKAAVIARLSVAEEGLGQAIRGFHQAVTAYYQRPHRVDEALAVIEQGVTFLQHVHAWYQGVESTDRT